MPTDREAMLWKADKIINKICQWCYEQKISAPSMSRDFFANALQAERDEAERACIRAACAECAEGHFPKTRWNADWRQPDYWHEPCDGTIVHCRGASTYEFRRRRAEGESDED